MSGRTRMVFCVFLFLAGVIVGVDLALRWQRHRPPCANGEIEIFWYSPKTGDHWSTCEENIPSR